MISVLMDWPGSGMSITLEHCDGNSFIGVADVSYSVLLKKNVDEMLGMGMAEDCHGAIVHLISTRCRVPRSTSTCIYPRRR